MIFVVLIEPEIPGNVGAIARSMKNFGLSKLVLVNPQCDHLSGEAIARSKHAKEVLKKVTILKSFSDLIKFDYLIATTAITGTDYNIPRVPLTPEDVFPNLPKNKKIALILGREGRGLSNSEIENCDFVIKIPSSKKYSTLNLSHAACIIFYELFKFSNKTDNKVVMASKKDKDILLSKIDEIIENLDFTTKDKGETQKKVWKRVIGKSFLTKREAFALFGFFRKFKKSK